ncbi:MAG: hypothetical protein K2P64_05925, partial [Lachnospiraceae bacterium]|nr:hypothetical protein [Lachnospiraceae bacterium]
KAEDNAEDDTAVTDVSGQYIYAVVGEEEETVEASGSVHQINMGWYERKDAKEKNDKVQIDGEDVSNFLWLAILGLLVSVLILLMITRAVYRKQRKARRRGRRR